METLSYGINRTVNSRYVKIALLHRPRINRWRAIFPRHDPEMRWHSGILRRDSKDSPSTPNIDESGQPML
ncbi:hypothetical protein E2C01_076000 [Portunus trituberculatus]|uniref:Uncharacterized protein n=1 Tax=Portunus trituberculatus TaxID=210409 RepID=A0A5B7IH74_PORTR|nr:hypothetical protein [Portunus trituberculatus]